MAILPRFITMMYNSTFFFQYETQKGPFHAAVRASSRSIVTENNFTKFEVVSSRFRGMVHIRSCYNNRYLQLNPVDNRSVLFFATANEPEEDRSQRLCTLFRFVISGDHVAFFHHSQNAERPVVVSGSGNHLAVATTNGRTAIRLKFTDMTSLVILPKHVLLKGDDGNYLRARKNRWLGFVANDPQDPRVHHISTLVPDTGNVRIMSTRYDNLYWQRTNNDWLRCEAGAHQNTRDSTFRPLRQSSSSQGNVIALLNMGNQKYCERWTSGRNAGFITASASNIPSNALMTVEEAIRDRQISNIRYHIEDARTHDMIPIRAIAQTVHNNGDSVVIQELEFVYEEVMEEMFTSSHSWKLSVTAGITVRLVPMIVKGRLTVNATYSGMVEWSKRKTTRERVTSSIKIPVPPRSSIRVTLIVGQGSMDVPFSYKQRDVLMDGTVNVKDMHDGLFSGLNTYELEYVIGEPERLLPNAMLSSQDDIVIVPGESMDLPRMPVSRVVDELEVEGEDQGEEKEPIPMEEEEEQGGEGELAPLPSSRL